MSLTQDWLIEEGFPTKKEVCSYCEGEGHHVNPALGAYTQSDREEMGDEWDEFVDNVRAGHYDVPCEECGGLRVVTVFDRDHATPEQIKRVDEWMQSVWESYAIQQAEMRAGA